MNEQHERSYTDDISKGYSHFLNEIVDLKGVLIQAPAEKKCLAIFDELFKGTNMEDAVQISSATISGLTRFRNSLFFISTHLHQLKNTEPVEIS